MDMIFAKRLSELPMRLIGVADIDLEAVGCAFARKRGIYTTRDYHNLYELEGLNLIIELTGSASLANEIYQTKPPHVRLMGNVSARLFWDLFQIEEERIAERKRAEQALRADGRFLQSVFDAIQDGVTVVDCEFNIVRVNSWIEKIFSVQGPLVGRKCYQAYQISDTPCPWCPSSRAIDTGEAHSEVVRLPPAKGSRWIELSAFPLRNTDGNVTGVIEHIKDISERKRAEEELEKRHRELEAINAVLLSMTREYDLDGMCRVLQDMIGELYPGFQTWIFLVSPERDRFFFPRPRRRKGQTTCYDRAKRRLESLELEKALLQRLSRGDIQPLCSGQERRPPEVIQRLAEGFPTWLTVPIEIEGETHGLFMLTATDVVGEPEADLFFVETLIRQISGVIRYQISKEVREEAFRSQLTGPDKFKGLVGRSKHMQDIYRLIQSVADSGGTVLITGESGTGKELAARAIHQAGKYKNSPFVVAHCSSFVPSLVHSEIFGHEKGAFTGAVSRKRGRLERAQGGIIFLDEVADLPLETQVLLLRFLQDRSFERVGGERLVEVDVRVIAATNKDMEKEMKAGRLREDFYYRLNVLPIRMPPLRERVGDIPLLADHFLRTYCLLEGKQVEGFEKEAMRLMMDYDWPGNVRELQNTIARCVVLASTDRIGPDVLPGKLRTQLRYPEYSLAATEKHLIEKVLEECNGNKHEAARLLKISRGTLYSKMKKHGISG
jgi:DNA-binding NtrC family response regulator/PAS domain-containing protein